MSATANVTALVGRVLMSGLFLSGGWGKLLAPAATQAGFTRLGLPLVGPAWLLAVVVELGGGLAILFGLFTRFAAVVLAIWCVATALVAHTHFAERVQEIMFFKNMAMTGGFLYLALLGAGAWSLDAWWGQAAHRRIGRLTRRFPAGRRRPPLRAAGRPGGVRPAPWMHYVHSYLC